MLAELRVRDLGVIEDVTVQFEPGMTALTGETGAGKTLLVEALELVLGQRADASLVRTGAEETVVEARFFDDAGNETVLARAVPASGRSRCWIDGRMAPVGALLEAGAALVDIHGQGEHQTLLHTAAQRRALDAFGGIETDEVEGLRRRLADLIRELAGLGGDEHERARELDVLTHQVAELDDAHLEDEDEDRRLASEEDRLADLAAHREQATMALGTLDAEGETPRALDLLGAAARALAGRPAFAALEDRLRAAQTELADVLAELRSVVETWEDDPQALAAVQARRRQLSDLYRKYGGDRDGALAFAEQAKGRLAELRRSGERSGILETELASVRAELGRAERVLLEARSATAPRLAAAVATRLGSLALAGARFEVEVDQRQAGDQVRFLFAANAGEALRPLARAASGGELARTMLALRLVAPGGPPTMVFDEVDAGVGGAAALALARSLREVAGSRQVLVVTHLAQVAAFAHHHVSVGKLVADGRVTTSASTVQGTERVVELSRMLSGQPDSKRARAHAAELLELVSADEAVASR